MAKARRQRGSKSPADSLPAEEPTAADDAPLVGDDIADSTAAPEERPSRRGILAAAAVVVACASATALLLSGWTPGPGSPPGAAPTTAPAARPAPAPKKVRRKLKLATVRKRPLTPKEARKEALARARNVSEGLFSSECGVCHTLAAAGTSGLAGPNLDKLRPTRARVISAIRNGGRGSGLMTPNLVLGNDATRIAQFVAQATHR